MKKAIVFLSILSTLACTETVAPVDNTSPAAATPPKTPTGTNETPASTTVDFSKQKKIVEGSFKSGAHTTTGKAFVYEDAKGLQTLVFEAFKTDAGPDLRIYLSNDLKASSIIEISKKVENGNQMYELPKNIDFKKQGNVLIWCKQFSVLFGSATFN
jgi:hypothetical protein